MLIDTNFWKSCIHQRFATPVGDRGSLSLWGRSVTAVPTRCRKCGSPERSPYVNRRAIEVGGVEPDGRRYRRVVWRRCQCLECGQWRDDVFHES